MLQVLVDADNVSPRRVQPVLAVLGAYLRGLPNPTGAEPTGPERRPLLGAGTVRVVASGRAGALARVDWPAGTEQLAHAGWQQADFALAGAYSPDDGPLLLVTGDGDFGLLASRHPGPVLVVSGAASMRLRDGATVVDPATDGTELIHRWLATHHR